MSYREEVLRIDYHQSELATPHRLWKAAEIAARADAEIDRLRSLIDGAMDIVEIWQAESPSQKLWRRDWLAGARDAVGSRP